MIWTAGKALPVLPLYQERSRRDWGALTGKRRVVLGPSKAHDRDSTWHPEWRVRAVPHDFTDPRWLFARGGGVNRPEARISRHPLGVEPFYNKVGLVFKEVKHGLHFTERSGVKGETVA